MIIPMEHKSSEEGDDSRIKNIAFTKMDDCQGRERNKIELDCTEEIWWWLDEQSRSPKACAVAVQGRRRLALRATTVEAGNETVT